MHVRVAPQLVTLVQAVGPGVGTSEHEFKVQQAVAGMHTSSFPGWVGQQLSVPAPHAPPGTHTAP